MIQEALTSLAVGSMKMNFTRKLSMDVKKMQQARLELAQQKQAINEQRLKFDKRKETFRKKQAKARLGLQVLKETRLQAKDNLKKEETNGAK